jgi:hypothetical protein
MLVWLDGKFTFPLKNLINVQCAVERMSNFDGARLVLRCACGDVSLLVAQLILIQ